MSFISRTITVLCATVALICLWAPSVSAATRLESRPMVAERGIGVPTVAAAYPSVYPTADGFRDTVTITTTIPSLAGPSVVEDLAAGSKLVIKLGTTVVKEWALTQTGTRSFTWNALNGGRIVAGTYTAVLTAIDSDSTTRTASTTVIVSTKKLVTATWTKKYAGSYFNQIELDSFPFDWICRPNINGVLLVDAPDNQGRCSHDMNITNADMRKSFAQTRLNVKLVVSSFRAGSPTAYFGVQGAYGSSKGFNSVKTFNFDMGELVPYDPIETGPNYVITPYVEVPYGAKYSISSITLTLTYKVLR